MGSGDNGQTYSVKGFGLGDGVSTAHVAAGLVLGALVLLILIRKGFRGVSVPGVGSVSVGK